MGAIDAALNTIDAIAAEGDLAPAALTAERLDLESAGEPIVLPDGKRIYPPLLHGEPVDRIACDLLDMDDPAALDVPAADRPARRGQEPDRARDRAPPVDRARPRGRGAPRRPVLRVRGDAAGPVLGRVLLPLRLRPGRRRRRPGRARGLGVRGGDARGLGGDDRRGQHRPRRLPAVDQRHPRRAPRPLPRRHRRDRDRAARVRGAARLQPRPGRRHRHPRRLALALPGHARGHLQLGGARAARRARAAGGARRCGWTASASPARTG